MGSATADVDRIEAQVLQWSPQLRASFAERLLESVADEQTGSSELSEIQIDEIVRRQQRHKNAEGQSDGYRESLGRLDRALAEFRKK